MARISPFRGLRYNSNIVGDQAAVVSPPYDVISPQQAADLQARSPYNAVYVDLPRHAGVGEPAQYMEAGAKLRSWISQSVLQMEAAPALYAYRQTYIVPSTGAKRQLLGFIGALELAPISAGVVLPHEHTFAKPKSDRLNLMKATKANLSQVYSFYSDPDQRVETAWRKLLNAAAVVDVFDDDGGRHEIWPITDAIAIAVAQEVLANVKVFIADGHHRYETALDYRAWRAAAEGAQPAAAWNNIMMMLVNLDAGGMTILPTHRVVTNTVLPSLATLRQAIATNFNILEKISALQVLEQEANRLSQGTMILYLGDGRSWTLTRKDPTALAEQMPAGKSAAWKDLDVAVLHQVLLEGALGLSKAAIDQQEQIAYNRDATEACLMVDSGAGVAAFILPAPSVAQVRDVALAGDVMPQKSTYFYPKLLTGLVFADLVD